MQRLFGTHNRGKHVAEMTGSTSGEEKLTRCAMLVFVLRFLLLVAASVTGGLLSKDVHGWVREGHCLPATSIAVQPAITGVRGEATADLLLSTSALRCTAPYWVAIIVSVYAACLAIICGINMKTGRVLAQAGVMPKIELLLKVLSLLAMVQITALAFSSEHSICAAGSAVGVGQTCDAKLDSVNSASCMHCTDGLFQGVWPLLKHAQKLAIASCVLWAAIVLIAGLRHWRAAKREATLKIARALDEAEMKEEFERRKAEEQRTKEKGKGEGKGVVYRMLM